MNGEETDFVDAEEDGCWKDQESVVEDEDSWSQVEVQKMEGVN